MDIKEILDQLGYSVTDDKDGWRTNAVWRNGDNQTSVKIFNDGNWIDFAHGLRGNIESLVKLTLGLEKEEDAQNWLKERDYVAPSVEQKPKVKSNKPFPPGSLNLLIPDHKYWIERGIPKDLIIQFKGGVALKNGKLKNRYVFPVFDSKNNILGFAGRCILKDQNYKIRPKWKAISNGRGKAEWNWPLFFNYKDIKKENRIILYESIGDYLSCATAGIKPGLVLFGTEISVPQINLLLKLNLGKIIISLNNDKEKNSVGNMAALKLEKRLQKYFDKSQIEVILPKLEDGNDWGDVLQNKGIEKIREYLEQK